MLLAAGCGAPDVFVSGPAPGAAAAVRIFDVVDPGLVQPVIVPVMARDYGASSVTSQPLARVADAGDGTRPDRSADVLGSRRRSEFGCDLARRRLVEEVTIELENRADEPRAALVRERLYRGLNWTLAYVNGTGTLEKEAAQTVLFRVELPPGARRHVVYRVVYTW